MATKSLGTTFTFNNTPVGTLSAISEMTCAGSVLIIMIGTNLMGITKIKVADYLPAILFAPIIYNITLLF